ncbi:hypothetical protein BDR03DRAFT_967313 [Suillus americanus]|nr:hypothetical protein BDR03DRAFT_967313 [Suillus americanus]
MHQISRFSIKPNDHPPRRARCRLFLCHYFRSLLLSYTVCSGISLFAYRKALPGAIDRLLGDTKLSTEHVGLRWLHYRIFVSPHDA